jgi:hypothetical protein
MGGVGVRDGELGAKVYAVINMLMRTARDRSPIGAPARWWGSQRVARRRRALPRASWLGDLPLAPRNRAVHWSHAQTS